MTETKRIRWEPTEYGGFTGHAGGMEAWLFQVWKTGSGKWQLDSTLPGQFGWHLYSDHDPEPLKKGAEVWLAEFVSSLGAVFPDRLRVDIARERDMYCGIAAQREREGRELQAERLHKYVDGLDRALALMDRMTPETTTPVPGKE